MRKLVFSIMMLLASLSGLCQNFIQGSVQQGATPNSININFLPNYTNAAGEYVNYLSFSIAIPTASASGVTPSLNMTGPFAGVAMTPAVPFTYTAGNETIWSWVYSSGSTTMSWTNDVSFTGATITFTGGTGASPVKLVDFTNFSPSGGPNSNTFFLIVTNKAPFDVANYASLFYGFVGTNGSTAGTYGNGDQYVQTNQTISLGVCNANPNAGTVSGTSPLCINGGATFASNGDAGGTWSSTNTSVATVNATTGVVTAVGAGTTNITYSVAGCTSVSSFQTLTVNGNVNAGTVSGSSSLCIGNTANYSSNGDSGGKWTSSNPVVATVSETTGTVTVVGSGTTDITYTVNSGCGSPVSAFKTLTVNPNVSAGTISGASSLTVGSTATFTSNGTVGGNWSSTNLAAATVNATTGEVTAVGTGTTNISYTVINGCGSPVSTFAALTVNVAEAHYIQGSIQRGTSANTVNINFLPNYTNAADEYANYLSISIAVPTASATSVTPSLSMAGPFATMSLVPAIPFSYTAGTETIWSWVYSSGPSSMSWTKDVAFTGATINFSGGTGASKVRIVDFNNFSPTGGSNSNTYFLVITNKAPFDVTNPANMFYSIAGANGSVTGNYPNTDQYVETVASISMGLCNANPNAGTVNGTSPLCINGEATFNSNGDAGGTWSSTNTAVATVNATTGVVTAIGVGTTDITYTVTGCSPVSSFKTLTVGGNLNAGTVSGTSPLCISTTSIYTSNGDSGGSWTSTNMAVATVDAATGAVTAVGKGTTNITYTLNTDCGTPVSAFKTLTVSPNVNAGAVSGVTSLNIGGTFTFTSNGDAGGSWESSNTAVAMVNATTGEVKAGGAGSTNITYTINSGCGSPVSAFAVLTVNAAEVHYITGSVQQGTSPNTVNINFLPNYTNAADEYVNYLSLSIAIPTVSASGVIPTLSMTGPFAGMTLVPAIPFSYTAGSETIWSWVYSSGPSSMSWTKNAAFTGATISFAGGSGTSRVRMVDFNNFLPTGGANSNTYFLVITNKAPFDVTNAANMFYVISGANGSATGTYPNGDQYVETIANISMSACNGTEGNAGIVSGLSPLCTESVVKYTTTGTRDGTWSSSNPAVARINPTTGTVTTVGAGTTNITYTVAGCGGPVTTFKTLTVTAPPEIIASNIIVNLTSSNCTQMVSFGSNVTVTNGSNIVYKIGNKVITSPAAFNAGQTTVTVSAANNCGTRTTSFIVFVKDLINPVVTCPGNIITTATEACTRTVNTNRPTFSDNCKIETVAWKMTGATTGSSPLSGINFVGAKAFNVGMTKITYTVWDASENASSCTFTVTVNGTGKCSFNHKDVITINRINISAFPNPSNHFFQLRINSTSKEEVYIRIMDITGRQLQQFKGQPDKLYRFGDGLVAGTYYVDVIQGSEHKVTKVVKQ